MIFAFYVTIPLLSAQDGSLIHLSFCFSKFDFSDVLGT